MSATSAGPRPRASTGALRIGSDDIGGRDDAQASGSRDEEVATGRGSTAHDAGLSQLPLNRSDVGLDAQRGYVQHGRGDGRGRGPMVPQACTGVTFTLVPYLSSRVRRHSRLITGAAAAGREDDGKMKPRVTKER